MMRSSIFRSIFVFSALVGVIGFVHAGPPLHVPGAIVSANSAMRITENPAPQPPQLTEYWNSGCLNTLFDFGEELPCGEDEFAFSVSGSTLHVAHLNALYNCCVDDIVVTLTIEGNSLLLRETDVLTTPCDCMCCYDVESLIENLTPGTYTVEYCWFDYDEWVERCHTDQIEIAGEDGPGQNTPGLRRSAEDPTVSLEPRVVDVHSTGCKDDPSNPWWWPPCGDDEFEITVGAGLLTVTHDNILYNCCNDEIAAAVEVDGKIVRIQETEIVPQPCYCVCCFETTVTVANLAPGNYQLEYCWYDYDTEEDVCVYIPVEITD